MDQGAGIGVFYHPQRAIGGLRHIANGLAHIPALGHLGAANWQRGHSGSGCPVFRAVWFFGFSRVDNRFEEFADLFLGQVEAAQAAIVRH